MLDDAAFNALVAALPLSREPTRGRVKAAAAGPELVLFGEVGMEITAAGTKAVLDTVPDAADLAVRINSPGGSSFEGFAIYAMLQRRAGRNLVTVEGVAASAASYIAMAGDEVTMAPASFLMIHNSGALVLGGSKAMRDTADLLDRVDGTMAAIYAARTGLTPARVLAMMAAETWMTADEAVQLGFASKVEPGLAAAACGDLSRYRHPPAALLRPAIPVS